MVLDNHTATITMGDQVPVQTATTNVITGVATNTNTYQYKDTGVNLSVTPSVNAGNIVSMQIDQTVIDVLKEYRLRRNQRFCSVKSGAKWQYAQVSPSFWVG